jgi:hypothetical protein
MNDRHMDERIEGVLSRETARYLTKIAKLPPGSIITQYFSDLDFEYISEEEMDEVEEEAERIMKPDLGEEENAKLLRPIMNKLQNKNFDMMINSYLMEHLENNHATIIYICFMGLFEIDTRLNEHTRCHAIVVYKRNDKIEFFDPQTDKENAGRSTIESVMDLYGDFLYLGFWVYSHINPLEEDILLDNDRSCHISFGRSPHESPDSPL